MSRTSNNGGQQPQPPQHPIVQQPLIQLVNIANLLAPPQNPPAPGAAPPLWHVPQGQPQVPTQREQNLANFEHMVMQQNANAAQQNVNVAVYHSQTVEFNNERVTLTYSALINQSHNTTR